MGRLESRWGAVCSEYNKLLKKYSELELPISQDVIRTFPNLDDFKQGKLGYAQMLHVLKCVSLRYPHVGYCQGMNFLAGLFILFLGEEVVRPRVESTFRVPTASWSTSSTTTTSRIAT